MKEKTYKIPLKIKNLVWPTHKKRIKLLRTLRRYFSEITKTPVDKIKIDTAINLLFHSQAVPDRKFLNKLLFEIIQEEEIKKIKLVTKI